MFIYENSDENHGKPLKTFRVELKIYELSRVFLFVETRCRVVSCPPL